MMDDANDVTASRTQKTSRATSNKSAHRSCSMCATQVADKTQITIRGEIHNDVTSRKGLKKKRRLGTFLGIGQIPVGFGRNAAIINRQSEGCVSVHKGIAKLFR